MRKFHDYDWIFPNGRPVEYRLTGCPRGSGCRVYPGGGVWVRKTWNGGANDRRMDGSVRYVSYPTEQEALDAGVAWAWRKDMELARSIKRQLVRA